jgi:hypothetical protein
LAIENRPKRWGEILGGVLPENDQQLVTKIGKVYRADKSETGDRYEKVRSGRNLKQETIEEIFRNKRFTH